MICVTGSPEVEALVAGPDGLAAAGKKLMIIDCSTSDPSSTIRLAAQVKERGITLIDAPLSRTPKDAEEGTLDVMVGGADADVGAGEAGHRLLRRPRRAHRADRQRPHDEAAQQFRLARLCRASIRKRWRSAPRPG